MIQWYKRGDIMTFVDVYIISLMALMIVVQMLDTGLLVSDYFSFLIKD